MRGSDQPCRHRETVSDGSGRGAHYLDDRTELAYVYDGPTLRAICFHEQEVSRYREETTLTVSLTPAGECRIDGNCRPEPSVEASQQGLFDRIRSVFGQVIQTGSEDSGGAKNAE